jgi:hypothetical protein
MSTEGRTAEQEIARLARQAMHDGVPEMNLHAALQRGIDDWYDDRYRAESAAEEQST